MAKTALLGQNDNLAIENLKQSVGRSVFNLSHSTSFPIDVDGAILPILAMETVPTDSFKISNECLLRQLSPLKVPLMTNLRLNTAYFYCANRMAWKKWDRFISGGRSGNETYSIPQMCNKSVTSEGVTTNYLKDTDSDKHINYKNSLHTYFHVSLNNGSNDDDMPLAFPSFDYQIICRDFYTNIDRIASTADTSHFDDFNYPFADWAYDNLFPVDDDEIRLNDGVQLKSGFSSGDDSSVTPKGFVLDKVRYHDVRDDYYTVQKIAPMRGEAPSITSPGETLVLPSGTAISLQSVSENGIPQPVSFYDVSQSQFVDGAQKVKLYTQSSNSLTSAEITPANFPSVLNNYSMIVSPAVDGDKHITLGFDNNRRLFTRLGETPMALETTSDISVQGESTFSITAQEIRLLSQLTVWQELNMLHKPTYNDFLNAHFESTKVGDSLVEAPQYIGGTSQIISINEILQNSASTETSPLGTQGATAMSLAGNDVGSFFCPDYGWIIGVAFVLPELLYNPALPRAFSRRTKEDYYFPEFANLSMQATLNKELFYSNDDDYNNTPLGYTGAFDEMRSIPNYVAGDFLNSSYTDLKAWILRREFDNSNKPTLSQAFLSLKDNVDKTAWQVPSMPAFVLQCANYIKANRPMPYVAIPKAL